MKGNRHTVIGAILLALVSIAIARAAERPPVIIFLLADDLQTVKSKSS